jgi:hypothetical protein
MSRDHRSQEKAETTTRFLRNLCLGTDVRTNDDGCRQSGSPVRQQATRQQLKAPLLLPRTTGYSCSASHRGDAPAPCLRPTGAAAGDWVWGGDRGEVALAVPRMIVVV